MPNQTSTNLPRLVNEVRLSGKISTDPKQFGSGPFRFRLSHGGGGVRKDGTPYPVQFFSVEIWDKKLIEGLSRGQRVEVSGKLRYSKYTAKDGTDRESISITASALQVESEEQAPAPLTPDQTHGTAVAKAILKPAQTNAHGLEVSDDDIPF
jgi:single-stranded DNA-binding protein